jgi:1-deoxy-D-xylulose-5-phosphate synthase
MAPSDAHELKNALYNAVYNYKCPVIIRYPKGKAENFNPQKSLTNDCCYEYDIYKPGQYNIVERGGDAVIVSCGTALGECKTARSELIEKHSISCEIIDIRFAKPISDELISEIGDRFERIVCIEDNSVKGGVGEEITARLYEAGYNSKKVKLLGLPDRFVEHGPNAKLRGIIKTDAAAISEAVLSIFKRGEKCRKNE